VVRDGRGPERSQGGALLAEALASAEDAVAAGPDDGAGVHSGAEALAEDLVHPDDGARAVEDEEAGVRVVEHGAELLPLALEDAVLAVEEANPALVLLDLAAQVQILGLGLGLGFQGMPVGAPRGARRSASARDRRSSPGRAAPSRGVGTREPLGHLLHLGDR